MQVLACKLLNLSFDFRCLLSGFRFQTFDFWLLLPGLGFRISCQLLYFMFRFQVLFSGLAFKLAFRNLDVGLHVASFVLRAFYITGVRFQVLDFRFRISSFIFQSSAFRIGT